MQTIHDLHEWLQRRPWWTYTGFGTRSSSGKLEGVEHFLRQGTPVTLPARQPEALAVYDAAEPLPRPAVEVGQVWATLGYDESVTTSMVIGSGYNFEYQRFAHRLALSLRLVGGRRSSLVYAGDEIDGVLLSGPGAPWASEDSIAEIARIVSTG